MLCNRLTANRRKRSFGLSIDLRFVIAENSLKFERTPNSVCSIGTSLLCCPRLRLISSPTRRAYANAFYVDFLLSQKPIGRMKRASNTQAVLTAFMTACVSLAGLTGASRCCLQMATELPRLLQSSHV